MDPRSSSAWGLEDFDPSQLGNRSLNKIFRLSGRESKLIGTDPFGLVSFTGIAGKIRLKKGNHLARFCQAANCAN